MKLYYTPRSHFSRKVRILMAGLQMPHTLVDVGNVADSDAAQFGDNPLMKIPALKYEARTIFDSDHIARYLVNQVAGRDPFGVLTDDVALLNLRAVMNGIMAAEVSYLLAQRTGIQVAGLPRFEKLKASMRQGLVWLESHVDHFPKTLDYANFHLVSMWDHLELYQILALPYPRLKALADDISNHEVVAASKPV